MVLVPVKILFTLPVFLPVCLPHQAVYTQISKLSMLNNSSVNENLSKNEVPNERESQQVANPNVAQVASWPT